MPTGYTSKIYEGKEVTKEAFIMECARAFGALIEMRDEPSSTEIPKEFKPNNYYLEQKEKKEKELEALLSLTHDEINEQLEKEYVSHVEQVKSIMKEKTELKNRYEKLLNEIKEWTPPTEEHVNLKQFCMNQLQDSIDFDCGGLERYESQITVKQTAEEWIRDTKQRLEKDIAHYQKHWEEEVARVEKRNQWVQALRESLTEKQ